MITFEQKGSFKKTDQFLKKLSRGDIYRGLDKFAQIGVAALAAATPVESGATAAAWSATVKISRGSVTITWSNSNVVNGAPIAIMLQYGHGTGTGGYVQGRNYINPAIKPVFDKIQDDVWRVVTSA